MITCGIDSGKSGSFCLLVDGTSYFYDYPKNENIDVYFSELEAVCNKHVPKLIVIEKVHSMPKQGVKSTFSFGQNFGQWLGFLAMLRLPYSIVPPNEWRKGLVTKSDGPNPKDAVMNVATRLFPNAKLHGLKGGYRDGRGDALLIAEYARRLANNL